MEVLSSGKDEKEIKCIRIEEKAMITQLSMWKIQESVNKPLELISEYGKVTGYNMYVHIYICTYHISIFYIFI